MEQKVTKEISLKDVEKENGYLKGVDVDTNKCVYMYKYPQCSLTVDIMILSSDRSKILLIQRKFAPFQGHWAFPGGFVDIVDHEDPLKAAQRELFEETGVSDLSLSQVAARAGPNRDPRGYTCTLVYMCVLVGDYTSINPKAGDDARSVDWFSVNELPDMAFDHLEILKECIEQS